MKYRKILVISNLMLLIVLTEGEKSKQTTNMDKDEDIRSNFLLKQKLHQLKELSQKASKRLADLTDYSTFYTSYVKNLLRVRVPGTVGHREVREFIVKNLKESGWEVELDEFVNQTPLGLRTFTNIIATLNPKAERRLALAAHYDSKLLTPQNGKYFIAASDSAVPCAMLLDFAKLLKGKFDDKKKSKIAGDVSPMLLFLDGEEAFDEWTATDSLYGSRHLADLYENRILTGSKDYGLSVNMLDSMDAFVLFDLIGMKGPQFYDLFSETSNLYRRLQKIEIDLKSRNLINNKKVYFPGKPFRPLAVEDDHLPFLKKGVPILHLISVPFPKEWHTLNDDENALDARSIEHLLKIFRQFLLEYFHLT